MTTRRAFITGLVSLPMGLMIGMGIDHRFLSAHPNPTNPLQSLVDGRFGVICPNTGPVVSRMSGNDKEIISAVVWCSGKDDVIVYLAGIEQQQDMPADDRPTIYMRINR